MAFLRRMTIAVMVGLSGAAVMAALNWGHNFVHEGPLLLGGAFGGAVLAGLAFAGQFGARWPVSIFGSLAATVFGSAIGALLVMPQAEALLIGPNFVIGSLLDSPLLLIFWMATQLSAHLAAARVRRLCC
ncbi:MAG: hypothetical protein R3E44_08515 [Paracoccaceae bacterium]